MLRRGFEQLSLSKMEAPKYRKAQIQESDQT